MKERGILFSAPMVRAILAGTKTQTRRAVKPQPDANTVALYNGQIVAHHFVNEESGAATGYGFESGTHAWRCPYGQPGDRLWVRETWAAPHAFDHLRPSEIPIGAKIIYAADSPLGGLRSRPSMFMPRWASRITLEITGVRVQRLREISTRDILAEGAVLRAHDDRFGHNPVSAFDGKCYFDLKSLWAHGWESINGPGSWAANPWVWCLEFRRVPA